MLADTNAELAKLKADLADAIALVKAKKDSDAARRSLFKALDTDANEYWQTWSRTRSG